MEDQTPKKPQVENVTTAETNSPTTSDASRLSDPPKGYIAPDLQDMMPLDAPEGYIAPDQQDMMLTDITSEMLHSGACTTMIGRGNTYLSEAKSFPLEWPAFGCVFGHNRRLMISLPCRRPRRDRKHKALNVFFLVDTGSPYSYLCQEAMTSLIGTPDCTIPGQIQIVVHNEYKPFVFHLSPLNSHFHDANVLGMDFLKDSDLCMAVDTPILLFRLFKSDNRSMLQYYPDEAKNL